LCVLLNCFVHREAEVDDEDEDEDEEVDCSRAVEEFILLALLVLNSRPSVVADSCSRAPYFALLACTHSLALSSVADILSLNRLFDIILDRKL
jgi:hypothetical protein